MAIEGVFGESAADRSEAAGRLWIVSFGALALVSGTTIGMSKVMASLFGVRLGATNGEIGLIAGLQSFAMAAATLPAGIVVARWGARRVYLAASLACMLAYVWTAGSATWIDLAAGMTAAALFIPFRIVAMSGSFMAMLPRIGVGKAGWYRACLSAGMVLIGPGLGALTIARLGTGPGFLAVALLFGAMALAGPAALLRRTPGAAARTVERDARALPRLLADRAVACVCAVEVAAGAVQTFFSTFILPVAIRVHGISEAIAVTLLFVEGIAAVATMFGGGPLLRDLAPARVYRLSFAVSAVGLALLGLATGYAGLAAGTLALGLGQGATHIVNVRQLSAAAGDKSRLAAVQLTASMSGGFAGSLVGGVIGDRKGPQAVFLLSALLFALLTLRVAWHARRSA